MRTIKVTNPSNAQYIRLSLFHIAHRVEEIQIEKYVPKSPQESVDHVLLVHLKALNDNSPSSTSFALPLGTSSQVADVLAAQAKVAVDEIGSQGTE